jgi:hypothetical protein
MCVMSTSESIRVKQLAHHAWLAHLWSVLLALLLALDHRFEDTQLGKNCRKLAESCTGLWTLWFSEGYWWLVDMWGVGSPSRQNTF